MAIKAISYVCNDIGARAKSSKKQYIWKFEIDSTMVEMELHNSQFSGKKRVFKNGTMIMET
jgi:hypothetical protein